jgi:putative GTP pyrophosphokinase
MTGLREAYAKRRSEVLTPLAKELEQHLRDCFKDEIRIDRITTRAKSTESFLAKAARMDEQGETTYSDPISQIQDQLGARIVVLYADDVERIAKKVVKYYKHIEEQDIIPDRESEFGYIGRHFILLIPTDVLPGGSSAKVAPGFFELQVKTLYQHAWSEANHDLGYKPDRQLSSDDKRRIAFTVAQSWGADMIFKELHRSTLAAASASGECE